MIYIKKDSEININDQIVKKISNMILCNALKEGEKLPSVRELSSKIIVNPNTVQKAYSELIRKGLVKSEKGKGIFVCKYSEKLKEEQINNELENFKRSLKILMDFKYDKKKLVDIINNMEV